MSNAAVQHSIKSGDTIKMGKDTYRGKNPQYAEIADPGGITKTWRKITKGIPFVRVVVNNE